MQICTFLLSAQLAQLAYCHELLLRILITLRYADDNAAKEPPKPADVKTEEPEIKAEVKTEEHNEHAGDEENDDEHMQNGDKYEDEDEVDFNLGNGNGNNYNAPQEQDGSTIGIKEDG